MQKTLTNTQHFYSKTQQPSATASVCKEHCLPILFHCETALKIQKDFCLECFKIAKKQFPEESLILRSASAQSIQNRKNAQELTPECRSDYQSLKLVKQFETHNALSRQQIFLFTDRQQQYVITVDSYGNLCKYRIDFDDAQKPRLTKVGHPLSINCSNGRQKIEILGQFALAQNGQQKYVTILLTPRDGSRPEIGLIDVKRMRLVKMTELTTDLLENDDEPLEVTSSKMVQWLNKLKQTRLKCQMQKRNQKELQQLLSRQTDADNRKYFRKQRLFKKFENAQRLLSQIQEMGKKPDIKKIVVGFQPKSTYEGYINKMARQSQKIVKVKLNPLFKV